jgi:hypothetical protein
VSGVVFFDVESGVYDVNSAIWTSLITDLIFHGLDPDTVSHLSPPGLRLYLLTHQLSIHYPFRLDYNLPSHTYSNSEITPLSMYLFYEMGDIFSVRSNI